MFFYFVGRGKPPGSVLLDFHTGCVCLREFTDEGRDSASTLGCQITNLISTGVLRALLVIVRRDSNVEGQFVCVRVCIYIYMRVCEREREFKLSKLNNIPLTRRLYGTPIKLQELDFFFTSGQPGDSSSCEVLELE